MSYARYLLESLSFLDWWLLAALLAFADVFLSRRWLLPPAAAAGFTGFGLLLFPQIPWVPQLAGFVLLTAVGAIAYLVWRRRAPASGLPGGVP